MKYTKDEKEAITEINKFIFEVRNFGITSKYSLFVRYSEFLLKLVEKQQEQIEKKDKLLKFNKNYINQLEQDLFENASNYVVTKEAIREKIEELQEELKSHEEMELGILRHDLIFATKERIRTLKELLGE